jgi:glutathione synthase/RimK-type ligase-like ATP-grasp enzyme
MVVQQFIDTGRQLSTYRVLTLFGEPLYCEYSYLENSELVLTAADAVIESTNIAIQGDTPNRHRVFRYDADMVALARAAHRAIPEVPLKGCDILRDHRTGRLYVIEVNPNSNTWHFSSRFMAKLMKQYPAKFPPELARQRLEQLDAFGTAAHVLAEATRREAV